MKKVQLKDNITEEDIYPITHVDYVLGNIANGGGECSITIDEDFDNESKNPLENRIISTKFDKILLEIENISERLSFIEEKFAINYCSLTISFKGIVEGTAYVIYNDSLHQVKFGEIIKIPYDTSVMVSGVDVEGYITPPMVTFIPNEPTKVVELEYTPAYYVTFNITGSAECNATINYDTLAGTQTKTVHNGDRIAVPNFCTVYVTPQEQYGYDTPEPQEIYVNENEMTVDLDFVPKSCTVTMKLEGLSSIYLISARGTITWGGNSVTLRDGETTQIPFGTSCVIEGNSLLLSYTAPPPEQIVIDNLDYTAIIKYN